MNGNMQKERFRMGTRAKLSILGLYDWDKHIFDNLVIPDTLNKTELVYNLLMETADLTVVYPDSDFFKMAVGHWSQIRLHAWERMSRVLYEDYDPYINIKRDETREIIEERNLKGTEDYTKDLDGTSSNHSGTTVKVNAWETATLQDQSNTTANDSGSVNSTDTLDRETTDTGTVKTTEHYHVEGDSAITDAQDVLVNEINARVKYDLYRIIIDEFKQRFCLLIY